MKPHPHERKMLPAACSLAGSNHIPPIDNQGAIGSCASQAANHMQFTNAYSRFLHAAGVEPQRCPKDDPNTVFTPRFTYNFSGAGTAWVYDVIKDHGSLTVAEWSFDKDEKGGHRKFLDGKVIKATAAWPVAPGQMKKALQNRIIDYEQIWMSPEPYKECLTTNEAGRELLRKIKQAVVDGNCVVTGGYPGRWLYAPIINTGSYGKPGDNAVIAAAGNGGGGHQVTIVGYDDDITAEFAGVTLRGAFQIANSYGTGWQNQGFTWMFYDTVNTVSEYEKLNDPVLYSGQMFVTPAKGCRMYTEALAMSDQNWQLREAGSTEISGESYTVYELYSAAEKAYLGYETDAANRAISLKAESGDGTKWCFIPYEKLQKFDGFDEKEAKTEYTGSCWVYALNKGDEPVSGARYLDAGTAPHSLGRGVALATLNAGRYPMAKSWDVTIGKTTKLGITAGKDEKTERIWTLDQFCFTDWRKDVVRGLPTMYFDVVVETTDRDAFTITLTRTGKDGTVEKYMPALFRYAACHPRYVKKDEYSTFSAKTNGRAEVGYFTLGYSELLKLPAGRDYGDYTWGFEVSAAKDKPVTVKSATLYFAGSDTPLSKITKEKTVKKTGGFKF